MLLISAYFSVSTYLLYSLQRIWLVQAEHDHFGGYTVNISLSQRGSTKGYSKIVEKVEQVFAVAAYNPMYLKVLSALMLHEVINLLFFNRKFLVISYAFNKENTCFDLSDLSVLRG